ncbi:MAG: DUF4258 domain-containing protein [Planctomycetota bacterium]
MTGRPAWWDWELELSPHLLKRMKDRGFNETDLREMIEVATDYRPGEHPGRFVLATKHAGNAWEVVVEPDDIEELSIVITAYPVT